MTKVVNEIENKTLLFEEDINAFLFANTKRLEFKREGIDFELEIDNNEITFKVARQWKRNNIKAKK